MKCWREYSVGTDGQDAIVNHRWCNLRGKWYLYVRIGTTFQLSPTSDKWESEAAVPVWFTHVVYIGIWKIRGPMTFLPSESMLKRAPSALWINFRLAFYTFQIRMLCNLQQVKQEWNEVTSFVHNRCNFDFGNLIRNAGWCYKGKVVAWVKARVVSASTFQPT